jgi:diacylglycerol kinase (ATP)
MLYGKISIEQQIEKLLEVNVYSVDAGVCNEKLFLNGVGIGFDGAIVKSLLSRKKNPGKASYLASVFRKILFYKATEHVVKIDDHLIREKLLMINIANGKTEGGGFRVAPNANFQDGMLDVNIVKELSSIKRFFYLQAIEKGKHLHLPLIKYFQGKKIEINTQGIVPAHADGEYFEADQFVIECLPGRFSFLW